VNAFYFNKHSFIFEKENEYETRHEKVFIDLPRRETYGKLISVLLLQTK
jgi:hypothetical protein